MFGLFPSLLKYDKIILYTYILFIYIEIIYSLDSTIWREEENKGEWIGENKNYSWIKVEGNYKKFYQDLNSNFPFQNLAC